MTLRSAAQAVVDAFPPSPGTPRGDALEALREALREEAAHPESARSTPAAMMHLALLEDLVGYVAGRNGTGYKPTDWTEHVRLWLRTPRGEETLNRMALVHRGPCKCDD